MIILRIVLIVIKQRLNMVNTDKLMKRKRTQSSSNEDCEPPTAIPKTSPKLESSSVIKNVRASVITPLMTTFTQKERPTVIIPPMSLPRASLEREDKQKKQNVRVKEMEQELDRVKAEKKKLTEQLEWSDCLRRTAEIRAAKLKIDLTKFREATEKAIKEKEEAEKEAKEVKEEATKMKKKIESINSNLELENLAETELQYSVQSAPRSS